MSADVFPPTEICDNEAHTEVKYADPGPNINLDDDNKLLRFEQLEPIQEELCQGLVDAGIQLYEPETAPRWECYAVDYSGAASDVVMAVNAWLAAHGVDFLLVRYDMSSFDWIITLPQQEAKDNARTAEIASTGENEWPPRYLTYAPAGEPSANRWPYAALKADATGAFLETVLCLDQWIYVSLDLTGVKLNSLPRPNKPRGRMRPVGYHLTGSFPVIRDHLMRRLLQAPWPFMFSGGKAEQVEWTLMLPAKKVRSCYQDWS